MPKAESTIELYYAPVFYLLTPLIFLFVSLFLSCSDAKPGRFPVQNLALTEDGETISGLRVSAQGIARGETDNTGRLLFYVEGHVGARVSLSGICPEGYRARFEKQTVTLRYLNSLDNRQKVHAPEISWCCIPLLRTAALVVNAPEQPGLAIVIRGQSVGRTTPEGVAHLLLKEPPGSKLSVSLDTAAYPFLLPQNPERIFHFKDRDTIFIFDQKFIRKAKTKRRRKNGLKPNPYIPYKIVN
ncbi:MAG: hypothetical protein JXA30_20965 [Deltaproteobacteria bacterium]|nr:hypothetical protein [Deltaproteobacteria bacterium]